MNILLVGSGGREHALAWTLSASPLVTRLYCAPGNAGIAQVAECVAIDQMNLDGLVRFAKEKRIDFAVIGPEAPLTAGLADRLEEAGIHALGPSAAGAQLEASKGFVKDLCAEHGIPTARYRRCKEAGDAKTFAASLPLPVVVKADGLAAGKGVIIAATYKEANDAIDSMFGGAFGDAGKEVVVEEFLEGEEASFFALTDGTHILPLAGAQDHKRVFDGDQGPNTGGMGAYSPAPVLTADIEKIVMARIVKPTVDALRTRGTPYQGVLYAGLMIKNGEPKLIEYNCRFGDPECQVLMLRLKSDLLSALIAARDGVLDQVDLRWRNEVALTVVMAANGYPGSYEKGSEIKGLAEAARVEGVEIFHAGTVARDGRILANGGRVLNVSAVGKTVREAQARAYEAIDRIQWPGGFCRRDIGWRAVLQEKFTPMMLWLAAVLFLGGALCLKIDRQAAAYFRERLHLPALQFAWRITNWAKGLPWIIAALVFYGAVQALMAVSDETPFLRAVSDYSLALLASFVVSSIVLHTIKIFLGRRRPRDDFEHGLYGFRYFTWELQFDSFPSGHAMTIFCVAVVLSAIQPLLAPLWLLLAAGLAATRALMTAHFFSDVLIGAAIGILATRETLLFGFPQLAPAWF